eukprot:12666182-Heterocapsa_arctica.AAC.1
MSTAAWSSSSPITAGSRRLSRCRATRCSSMPSGAQTIAHEFAERQNSTSLLSASSDILSACA